MERRSFLRMMVGGIATAAAARTFPFRVFSFPKEIRCGAAMYRGPLIEPISIELLQDTDFDIEKFVAQEMARRY